MALYDFKCVECGKVKTQMLTMTNRDNPEKCDCGGENKRHYTSGNSAKVLKYAPMDWGLNSKDKI